jgi:hypothetical protein
VIHQHAADESARATHHRTHRASLSHALKKTGIPKDAREVEARLRVTGSSPAP